MGFAKGRGTPALFHPVDNPFIKVVYLCHDTQNSVGSGFLEGLRQTS